MGQLRTANKRANRALARVQANLKQVDVAAKPAPKGGKA